MQIISINHPREWNHFVKGCPNAAYTHLYEWRSVIGKIYGHNSLYLAAVDKNKGILAALPLFRIKRPLGNPHWISIPFFDQAGILGDPNVGKKIIENAGIVLNSNGAASLSLRQDHHLGSANLQMRGKDPLIFDEKVSMHIPLAPNQKEMMARFRSKLRNQINKGIKNGLTWDIGKERLIDPFYLVFSRNMRDLGSPVHSKRFFKAIFNFFPKNAFICVVYHKRTPVAASFLFRFKNRIVNPWASSLREYRHLNTNMVLYWQMIGFACNLGLEVFDMGRSSRGASTHKFKQQWDPKEESLKWYTWEFGEKKTVGETLTIVQWKKIPVWGANIAGPIIRKYISL